MSGIFNYCLFSVVRLSIPVLDTEVSDNVRYSKTIMLILIFCLAVLIVYRARGIV